MSIRCRILASDQGLMMILPRVPVPGAVVAARKMERDPRSEPQYAERVPYVIAYSDTERLLAKRATEPQVMLADRYAFRVSFRPTRKYQQFWLPGETV